MKRIIALGIIVLLAVGAVFWSVQVNAPKNSTTTTNKSSQKKTTPTTDNGQTKPVQEVFNAKKYSIDDPTSPWVVVNKLRPLQPKSYTPSDLRVPNVALRSTSTSQEMKMRDPAATALETMFASAKQAGVDLLLASGYRSYNLQVGVYNRNVATLGQATADTQSARPGHSEHQTGLAVDVGATNRKCEIEGCFANTAEGKWVAENAHAFGFIVRYQTGSQQVTGYMYEPWHLRFVGTELSTELHRLGNPTLEAFFGLPAAPNY